MLPGKKFTPEEILRIAVRRKWLILVPLALGLATAPAINKRVPELYRSETLIMVVPQRIPDSYVKSTVTARIEDRLPSISDQILSRSRLEQIITDHDLYREQRAAGIMEDVIERMRAEIAVTLEGRGKESFRVAFANRNPRTAQQVAERLASLYIEENLRDRENLAESTNEFLAAQLEDAKQRLIEHERKLEQYRRRHSGQLPSQLQGNLQAIQNAQLQLQAVSESMNRAKERRLLVERQLADAQVLPAVLMPGTAITQEPAVPVPITSAQQLEAAEARLELIELRYKPDHPDIRALERTIRDLQVRVENEAKQPPEPTPEKAASPAELARQKRIRDLQAELDVIDRQLASNHAEEARLKATIGDYQTKIDLLPTRESELVELTRDYATLQSTYASLLEKREDSKLAANLERRQIGEQFRILDPASLPERPYNQRQRIAFTSAGAIAGLVIGLALVAFLEYRDSSFANEQDVVRLLKLPVLALVPGMPSDVERRMQRRRRWVINTAAMGVMLASAAVLILWRLQP